MTILALDASTKSTGWSIFNNEKLIEYGCFTATSTDLIKRIYKITEEIKLLLLNHQVDKIILEEVRTDGIYGANSKVWKALAQLQASINFMIYNNFPNISIEYIYPSSWRKNCGIHTGRGIKREALKEADINFVKQKFGIEVNDDIADSIGIGQSYIITQDNEINWG